MSKYQRKHSFHKKAKKFNRVISLNYVNSEGVKSYESIQINRNNAICGVSGGLLNEFYGRQATPELINIIYNRFKRC